MVNTAVKELCEFAATLWGVPNRYEMVSTMFKTTIENSSLNFRKHETRPYYGAEMSGFTARLSFLLNAHITCE